MICLNIAIRGVVQGIGFRPFVFRLANELGINGWVKNTPSGISIVAEGTADLLDMFVVRLRLEKPALSSITALEKKILPHPFGCSKFEILSSEENDEPAALILPDLAICSECKREISDPSNRRYRYPFTNCTHCGPRYSIIQALPYDRAKTTMKNFFMCPECEREYHDPMNRRFHAQPNACSVCGPHLELWNSRGTPIEKHDSALRQTAELLREGNIIALKGLGGFQLLVDATNTTAVNNLRARKHREEKPFAVMFSSPEAIRYECELSDGETKFLQSVQSPIVLLRRKENILSRIAPNVAPGNPQLGVMLPYTPLHLLLLNEISFPLVATSGNISEEPICIDEHEALQKLHAVADYFLVHNRPIERYVDDSVLRVTDGDEMLLRRARGYAPLPILLEPSTPISLLALGGHLKNTIALQKNNMLFISQHIGDLENLSAQNSFAHTIEDLSALYNEQPKLILCDSHPEYSSTQFARNKYSTVHAVQHHLAHVASCMAEHHLTKPLLGISWDGTGYGTDGTIWGGEFIEWNGKEFLRAGTVHPFSLPGGESAVKEPRRSALGMLYELFGEKIFEKFPNAENWFLENEKKLLLKMLAVNINTPRTTSMGRIFDAVSAILNVRLRSGFEGQAAMELEFAAAAVKTQRYSFHLTEQHNAQCRFIVEWKPMIEEIIDDLHNGISCRIISARFHSTLSAVIVSAAQRMKYSDIVLTGGCFQNQVLLKNSIASLRSLGYVPYWQKKIPTNDGGIAAGQIYYHHLTS
ncbi:MAG: carbamoyltransferase HypF [Bacteroidetes bacterium]|nr:carbamoyltransferase HypF [Bacteroidota bacterium]